MSWYQQYLLSQAAKQQSQQQPQATVTHVDPKTGQRTAPQPYNGPTTPLPPEPNSPQDVVRQTPPSSQHPQGQIWVRNDYNARVTERYSTPSGVVTKYAIEPIDLPEYVPESKISVPMPFTEGYFPSNPLPLTGGQPFATTPERRTIALSVVTAVAAPAVAPTLGLGLTAKGILVGEAIGGGLNVGVQAVQGNIRSPTDLVSAVAVGAAEGALFTGAGGVAIKGIGSVGKTVGVGLPSGVFAREATERLGRVAINTAIGAGAGAGMEYAETGRVTPQGVIAGAGFGAAFGAAGELAGLYGPSAVKSIRGRIQNSPSGQRAQDHLNRYYMVDSRTGVRQQHLGLGEKVMMRFTGLKPQKPALNIVELPEIPTAPKNAYDVYKVPSMNEADSFLPVTNRKGQVVDLIRYKEEIPVMREQIVEKQTPESVRLTPKKVAGIEASDMLDANTVITGKSVEPSEYYHGEPTIPTGETSFNRSSAVSRELAFSKQGPDFGKMDLPEPDSALPKSMVESDIQAPKLSFNKAKGPVTEFEVYSFKESSKAVTPSSEKTLSFDKKALSFEELTDNIKTGKIKGVEVADGDVVTSKVIPQKSYGDYPWKGEDARVLISEGKISQAGKGRVFTVQDNPVAKAIVSGEAAQPTGVSKVLGDIQSGRTVEMGRIKASKEANPFAQFQGRSFYSQKSREYEEVEVVSTSYPNSGLSSPRSPEMLKTRSESLLIGEVGIVGLSTTGLSNLSFIKGGVLGETSTELSSGRIISPVLKSGDKQSSISNVLSTPLTAVDEEVRQSPLSQSLIDLDIPQTVKPKPIPDTEDIIKPIETADSSAFIFEGSNKLAVFGAPDFKFEGHGFTQARGRKRGAVSRRKRYPILDAGEFLGL